MDDRKLRIAFAKVKKDIIGIQEDLYDLAKEQANNKGVTNSNNAQSYGDKLKFDNFVTNVENELKALTLFSKELEDRISHIQTSKPVVEKSVSMPVGNASNKDLEDSFEQLEAKFIDFSELVNEKIDMEINALRLEFTEEIAKVYDRVFTEVLELKDEIKGAKVEVKEENPSKKEDKKKVNKKTNKKSVKKESKKVEDKDDKEELYQPISETTDKESGRLKKVMNWLFVDEEEEQIDDIKSEVKKIKEEDKEELY